MTLSWTLDDVLAEGGILSRRLEGFRERPAQVAMAKAIETALTERRHLMVEAPTGVGKSLAYLVPLLRERVAQGRKVVVSTHTIALQEQLLEKDLPLLASCLPVEFLAAKAMGRSNYLGLRRMHQALADAPTLVADDPEVVALRRIAAWSDDAFEGSRQEMTPTPPWDLWEQVQSEGDNCLGRRCPTFESCFYQKARRRLETADVIIVNHALYFSDLMLRRLDLGLLPEHDALILDEAHHVEQVAADHFGLEVSRRGMLHLLRRLAAPRGDRGFLHRFQGAAKDRALPLVATLRERTQDFFDQLGFWYSQHGGNGRLRAPGFCEDGLTEPLHHLEAELEILADAAERTEDQVEAAAFAGRSALYRKSLETLVEVADPDLVYFIENGEQPRRIRLVARPLEVAQILRDELFARVPSVVMTSATLATGRKDASLEYARARVGLDEAEELVLESPFDFARQVRLHVPASMPPPDDPRYLDRAAEEILEWTRQVRGGVFALFTSYQAMTACHQRIAPTLEREGYRVLRQGDQLDRSRLLQAFREDGNALLFGVESFWEGVDVPGPALRCVILSRLPFPVPTLPLHEARAEALKRQGKNPFRDYFLPEAVIRFRQGAGRLIRSEEDEGVIVCLDRRLVDKAYGKRFQRALPPAPWIRERSEAAREQAHD